MAPELGELPRFLVLNPSSTVRIELLLRASSCEIDLELERPRPGRSFILLLGAPGGPFVQRVRLSGKARVYFDPESPGRYELLLANPDREPMTLRLRARDVDVVGVTEGSGRPTIRVPGTARAMTRRRRPSAHRKAGASRRPRPRASEHPVGRVPKG